HMQSKMPLDSAVFVLIAKSAEVINVPILPSSSLIDSLSAPGSQALVAGIQWVAWEMKQSSSCLWNVPLM
ncbi:hypothetical protein HispidOSU_031283, partial [Sigmodon hispidus]